MAVSFVFARLEIRMASESILHGRRIRLESEGSCIIESAGCWFNLIVADMDLESDWHFYFFFRKPNKGSPDSQRRKKYGVYNHVLRRLGLDDGRFQWYFCPYVTQFRALFSRNNKEGSSFWSSDMSSKKLVQERQQRKNRTGTRMLAMSSSGTMEPQWEIIGTPWGN